MKAYDIVGYADIGNRCCYCLKHGSEATMHPILAYEKWGHYPICATCLELIDGVSLIEDD